MRMQKGVSPASVERNKSVAFRLGLLGLSQLLIATAMAGGSGAGSADLKSQFLKQQAAFTGNVGQWDKHALFQGRGKGVDLWITREGLRFDYYGREKDANPKVGGHVVGIKFVGGNALAPVGTEVKGVKDMVLNNKPKVRAAEYRGVSINNVYQGVKLVSYFEQGSPRYDFHVAPGTDPSKIKMQFQGLAAVSAKGKTLSFQTGVGTKKHTDLFAYQMVGGKKVAVRASFEALNETTVKFNIGQFDKSKELVIDQLIYGTYYGGDAGADEVRGVTTDNSNGVYITGYTKSSQYPVLFGPYGLNLKGGKDAFVSKIQGDAYNHDYSALIAGSGDEQGNYIATDSFDNVWVCGTTSSADFPTNGTAQSGKGWIMRFKPSGSTVLDPFEGGVAQIFRFGGTTLNSVNGFVVERKLNPVPGSPTVIRLIGASTAAGIPEIGGTVSSTAFFYTLNYAAGAFTAPAGQSAYLRVSSPATVKVTGIALDPTSGGFVLNGTLFATGNSDTSLASPIFDTTPGLWANSRLQRGNDIWIRRYDPTGNIVWSGLLGGAASDTTEGAMRTRTLAAGNPPRLVEDATGTTVAVSPDGNIYSLGRTNSYDFPRTRGVFGETFDGSRKLVTVTKITNDGTAITYSTHIHNAADTSTVSLDEVTASGIAVDPRGNAYITGIVNGTNDFPFPTPGDPNEPTATRLPSDLIPMVNPIKGTITFPASPQLRVSEAWMLMLNPDGTKVSFSTYIGGDQEEGIFAPYTDRFGDVWVFGWIDTFRDYVRVSSTGTVNDRRSTSGFTGGQFITPLAFKENPDQLSFEWETNVAYAKSPYSYNPGGFGPNALLNSGPPFYSPDGFIYRRDGYILRFRQSLPLLTSLVINPLQIPGGDPQGGGSPASATGTVTLSAAAPAGGATIFLSLDNITSASFDATSNVSATQVDIPAGSTSATFTVYGRQVLDIQNVQVKGDYAGNVKVGAFSVVPWLTSLTLSTTSVVGGNEITGIVQLQRAAPAGGVVVNLSTDRADVVSYPDGDTVTVAAGSTTANFRIATKGVVTTQIPRVNATLLGVTRTQTFNVKPAKLNRIEFSPDTVAGGASSKGTVFLDGAAGKDLTVTLNIQGNPADYSITPTVQIAKDQKSAEFTVVTGFETVNRTRIIQAKILDTDNVTVLDGPVSGALSVQAIGVSTFTIVPTTIESGGTAVGTITLSQPATTGGVPVDIIITNPTTEPNLVTSVASVTIKAGQTQGTVTLNGGFALNGAATAKVTAYRGPSTRTPTDLATYGRSDNLTVNPISYSITLDKSELFGGEFATGTVTISAPAPAGGLPVTISSSDPTVTLSGASGPGVPITITIPAGQTTSPSFTVTVPDVNQTRTISVNAQIGTLPVVSSNLTIKAIDVASITLTPNRVRMRLTTGVVVKLNAPAKVDTTIQLSFSNASLVDSATVGTITIKAGQIQNSTVKITTKPVPRTLSTQVSANVKDNTVKVSATLTVTR